MDQGDAAELRALRARAYGRHADITADTDALRRLAELDQRERAERTERAEARAAASAPRADRAPAGPAVDAETGPGSTPDSDDPSATSTGTGTGTETSTDTSADTSADTGAETSIDDPSAGAVAHTPRATTPLRRAIVGIAWAASLAVVAASTASITAWASARTAATATTIRDDAGIAYVTTLLPDEDRELPDDWGAGFGTERIAYDAFFGVVVTSERVDTSEATQECLFVSTEAEIERAQTDPSAGFGSFGGGCTQSAFPASAQFLIGRYGGIAYPDELTERYPTGTAFQLVLTDIGVDVFVAEPAEAAEAAVQGDADGAAGLSRPAG